MYREREREGERENKQIQEILGPGQNLVYKDLLTNTFTQVSHDRGIKTSKGMMGSLMVSSFCECLNSCANLVYTKNNILLSDDEIDMVVTLRMNRDFM